MEHSIVFSQTGTFAGWSANGGGWQWGDELLVSYQKGTYLFHPSSHCIDREKPIFAAFSRSMDGGRTWTQEAPQYEIYNQPVLPVPDGGFDFLDEGFVLRMGMPSVTIRSDRFIVSRDKGHTWEGPYRINGLDDHPLTMRTSYRVIDNKTLLAFLSWQLPNERGTVYSDRAFCAVTTDGGQTFRLLGEMTRDLPRSVMPSVTRLSDGTLVAAMRRRLQREKYAPGELTADTCPTANPNYANDNWIEVCRSRDGGVHWTDHIRAAETALTHGGNGNPPAMVCLPDDTLVLVYGRRSDSPALMVSVSRDGGHTFAQTCALRTDMATTDFGYPRLFALPDGSLCAVYYYNTADRPHSFIASTRFTLEELF